MPSGTTREELDADEDYQDWMAEGESEHYYNDMENEFQSLSQGDDPDKDKKIEALGSAGTPANVVGQQRKQQRQVEEDLKQSPDFFEDEKQSNKAEESNFGAGQRGLGYGNEGYTSVQGSGQSHTISEIPPEMEIIVHDINEIKESKKEGYTTEAGNSKRGDPSRATDDDDSLLSQTFVKNDPNWRSVNETVPKPKKDTPNPLDEDDDSLLAFPKEDSLDDGEVAPNM